MIDGWYYYQPQIFICYVLINTHMSSETIWHEQEQQRGEELDGEEIESIF